MRLLISACLLLALTTSCGSESDSASDSLTVRGHLTLEATDIAWSAGGEGVGNGCQGSGGYDDIAEGATVVVRDAKGDRVAVGQLGPGEGVDANLGIEAAYCRFAFKVPDVDSDSKILSVEVTHRGEITFKRADAGAVEVTLG